MQHLCIKPSCKKPYQDSDVEDYYCPDCNKERKVIAARIDAQMTVVKSREPIVSDLQAFEQSARKFTDPTTGREIFFGRA